MKIIMKKNILKNIILIMMVFVFSFSNKSILYAEDINLSNIDVENINREAFQNAQEVVTVDENINFLSVLNQDNSQDSEENIILQDPVDTVVVQDTVNPQESVDHTTLVDTKDDTEIVLTDTNGEDKEEEIDISQDQNTNTDNQATNGEGEDQDNLNNTNENQDESNQDQDIKVEENIDNQEVIEEQSVIVVSKPKPLYRFSISKNLPSFKKIKNPAKLAQKEVKVLDKKTKIANVLNNNEIVNIPDTVDSQVDSTVNSSVDNETGVVNLSGSCSDMYFVVLLYKNESDYREDRGSYILNKAFKCENGNFSYSVSDLPKNLSSGTYYMLIGDQGERGTWTPATQLTEININREE